MDTEYYDGEEEYEDCKIVKNELAEVYEEDDYEFETIIETVDVSKDLDYYDTFEIEDFSWNAECTKLFLNLYRERIHLFRDPKVKKKLIWKQMQDIFRNLGYSIGLLALAGKFRNLKRTFKQINSKISENENYPNKWPYYQTMAEILDENVEIDEDSKGIFVSEEFDEPEINLFDWNDEKIMLLLTSYRDRKLEFAKFRKVNTKALWKEIKAIFWSNDIKCTVEQLHKKYRLLRGTFRKIQEKQKIRGPYESKWPYFKIFEEITDVPQELIEDSYESKKAAKAIESMDNSEGIDKSFWTEDMIKLLLTLYSEKRHKFQNPLIKKRKLWKQMKNDFSLHGYDVTGEMLYKKFQNLKNTYQKIIQRHRESDAVFTRWPYYNLMKEVLANNEHITYDSDYVDDEEDYVDDEDEEPKPKQSECYYWSLDAVKILLLSYKERIAQFADKNVRKMDLWKEVTKHLAENGYDVDQNIVEKKFRTLKHRYLHICNLKQQNTCRWNFFQLMASIVNPDGTLKVDNKMEMDEFSGTSDYERFVWTPEKIELLLNNYYKRKESFFNPQTRNRNLWQEIVEDFVSKGYLIDEDTLSEKYRQLRNNFLRCRNKRNSSGQRVNKWDYYDLMAKIYEKNHDSDENDLSEIKEDEIKTINANADNRYFTWTFETTKLLINSYIERKDKFNNPHIRNTTLWNEMSKIFKSKNYTVTPTMLNKKFNTLKRTYTRNRLRLSKGVISASKWLFYNSMHKIFGDNQIFLKDRIVNNGAHHEDDVDIEDHNDHDDDNDNHDDDDDDDDDDSYPDFQFIRTDDNFSDADIFSPPSPKKDIETKFCIAPPTTQLQSDETDIKINNLKQLKEKFNEKFNSLENRLIKIESLLSKNNELQVSNNNMLKKYLTALHDKL